jgi:hypothetical protein
VALADIAILNKIVELLLHLRPVKNKPDALEPLLIAFVGVIVELSGDGCGDGRGGIEVDPILEINESCLHAPRSLDVLLLDLLGQGYKV